MTFRSLGVERSMIRGRWKTRLVGECVPAYCFVGTPGHRTAGQGGIRHHHGRRNQGVRRDPWSTRGVGIGRHGLLLRNQRVADSGSAYEAVTDICGRNHASDIPSSRGSTSAGCSPALPVAMAHRHAHIGRPTIRHGAEYLRLIRVRRTICRGRRRRGGRRRAAPLTATRARRRAPARTCRGRVRRCRAGTGSGRMPPNRRRGTAARPMALRWSHQPHRLSDRARVGSVDQRQALDQLVNSIHPVHPAGCAGTTTLAGLQRTRFSKRDRDQGNGASVR